MSFLSRFYKQWKQRQREIESERVYSYALHKSWVRQGAIELIIARDLVMHGVIYDATTVERLAKTVLDRECFPALQINNKLSFEEREHQRWELDCKISVEVVEEYMGSGAKEVLTERVETVKTVCEDVIQKIKEGLRR